MKLKKILILFLLCLISILNADDSIIEKKILKENDKGFGVIKEIIKYNDGRNDIIYTTEEIKKKGILKTTIIRYEDQVTSIEFVDKEHPKYKESKMETIATLYISGKKAKETITFTKENFEDKYRQKLKYSTEGKVETAKIIYFPEYTETWGIKDSSLTYSETLQIEKISYTFYNNHSLTFTSDKIQQILNYAPRLTTYLNDAYTSSENNNEINLYFPTENGSTLVELSSLKTYELNDIEKNFFSSPSINNTNYMRVEFLENNKISYLYVNKEQIDKLNNINEKYILLYYSFMGGLKKIPINIVVDF